MNVEIYHYNRKELDGGFIHDTTPSYLGYVEVDKFNPSEIHKLCNWSCWTKEKPSNLHADISYCDHGLCLIHPKTKKRYLSKSIGWLVGSEDKINKYVSDNKHNIVWH